MTASNPFWRALANKAQLSADYISTTKSAERTYYGRNPWSENQNGIIVDYMQGSRGVLDARRDFEVGVVSAQASLQKNTQAAAGQRDRDIADAASSLAQARGQYEVGWAQMGAENHHWTAMESQLPIAGSPDGALSTIQGAGTQFIPGLFQQTPATTTATGTSTGFGGDDLDEYFSGGFLADGIGEEGQTPGASGNDEPVAQQAPNGNQVEEPGVLPPDDGEIGYQPTTSVRLPAGSVPLYPNMLPPKFATLGMPSSPQFPFSFWSVGLPPKNSHAAELATLQAAMASSLKANNGNTQICQTNARIRDFLNGTSDQNDSPHRQGTVTSFDCRTGRAVIPNSQLEQQWDEYLTAFFAEDRRVNGPVREEIKKLKNELAALLDQFANRLGKDGYKKDPSQILSYYFGVDGPNNQMPAPNGDPLSEIRLQMLLVQYYHVNQDDLITLQELAHDFARILKKHNSIEQARSQIQVIGQTVVSQPTANTVKYGIWHTLLADGSWVPIQWDNIDPTVAAFYQKETIADLEDSIVILRSEDFVSWAAKNTTEVTLMIVSTFVPGVGEVMDLEALFAEDTTPVGRTLAFGSLLLGVLTLGVSPNFGRPVSVMDDVADMAGNGLRTRATTTRVFENAPPGEFRWWDLSIGIGDYRIKATKITILDGNLHGLNRIATGAHETVHFLANIYLPNVSRMKQYFNKLGVMGFIGSNIKFLEESIAYTIGGLIGSLTREGRRIGRMSEIVGPYAAWTRSLHGKPIARLHVVKGGMTFYIIYKGYRLVLDWISDADE